MKEKPKQVERKEIPVGWLFALFVLIIAVFLVVVSGPERQLPLVPTPTPVPTIAPRLPAPTPLPTPLPTATPTPQPVVSAPPFSGTSIRECGVIASAGEYRLTTDLYVSDVGNDFSCITIDAPNVVFDCNGHSITGSGKGNAILLRKSNRATVKNCVARGFKYGINVNSQSNVIEDNEFLNNSEGIWLWSSSGNVVRGNEMRDNYNYGLTVGGGSFNNVFSENLIEANGLGGAGGGIFEDTESKPNNTYSRNEVCGNGHDLVCGMGNMIDGGGNKCGAADACHVTCLSC
ncbi:MAG: right-handed parallel beta-helix repeat-containing protein [Candidatus Micrarchaeota archaeon]